MSVLPLLCSRRYFTHVEGGEGGNNKHRNGQAGRERGLGNARFGIGGHGLPGPHRQTDHTPHIHSETSPGPHRQGANRTQHLKSETYLRILGVEQQFWGILGDS